ncbi:hypothetical protein [Acidithiobacillus sp.]
MARGPDRLRGGTWTRLCGGVDPRGGGRARAAATAADGGGPAGADGGHDLDTRGLGVAGPMDMGTGALGLPAPSLRPLGAGSLVASGRALVLGSGSLGKTVICDGEGELGATGRSSLGGKAGGEAHRASRPRREFLEMAQPA